MCEIFFDRFFFDEKHPKTYYYVRHSLPQVMLVIVHKTQRILFYKVFVGVFFAANVLRDLPLV